MITVARDILNECKKDQILVSRGTLEDLDYVIVKQDKEIRELKKTIAYQKQKLLEA